MITTGIAILCIVLAAIVASTYFLITLPFLSYQQGKAETEYGEVTHITTIRPSVWEIKLEQTLEIDGIGKNDNFRILNSTVTRFFYLRNEKILPRVGQKISLVSINRYYRFTRKSFNWIKKWNSYEGKVPFGGTIRVTLEKF